MGPRTLGRGTSNPVAMGDRVRAYTVLLWAEGLFVRRASFQATRCYSTPPRLYIPKVHDMLHGLGGLHPAHNDAAKTERAPHSCDGRTFPIPNPHSVELVIDPLPRLAGFCNAHLGLQESPAQESADGLRARRSRILAESRGCSPAGSRLQGESGPRRSADRKGRVHSVHRAKGEPTEPRCS